jgi:exosortase H (IPTLxxWG-CTERM-specific)
VLLVAFELPLFIPAVDRGVIRPFTRGIAHVSAGIIGAMGTPVRVMDTLIIGSCFSVDIENGCNGVEATLFLIAAILAFPAPARSRAAAVAAGAAIIQSANLIRVVTLYLIGCYQRAWFDTFHLAIWQSVIFALAMLYFAFWTRKLSNAAQRA